MKIAPHKSQGGFIVIAVLIMLATMIILIAVSAGTLHRLGREMKLVEKRQTQRLAMSATNTPPAK